MNFFLLLLPPYFAIAFCRRNQFDFLSAPNCYDEAIRTGYVDFYFGMFIPALQGCMRSRTDGAD